MDKQPDLYSMRDKLLDIERRVSKLEENKNYKLRFYCDERVLREIAVEKDLTSRQIDLLVWKYSKKAKVAAMEIKFNCSTSTLKREIDQAIVDFYGNKHTE